MKKIPSILLVLMVALISPEVCYSALNLNVSTVDGSNRLKLGRVYSGIETKREVRLRIISTTGERYQVFQRIINPIVNDEGQSLDLNAIRMGTIPGSNAAGTLYFESGDRLSYGEQLIYTSGPNGESDAFIIEHLLDSQRVNAAGRFSGRILYSVRSMTSASQDDIPMDIYIDVAFPKGAITVEGARTTDRVKIKYSEGTQWFGDHVKIVFPEGSMGNVHIYQDVAAWPQTATGEQLPVGALNVNISSDGLKEAREGSVPLTGKETLIYSGPAEEGVLRIFFVVNDARADEQAAGLYSGRLRYTVSAGGATTQHFIQLDQDIEPIFSLNVSLPPEGMSFSRILPNDPPREKEVVVEIASNLKKPYEVIQDFSSLLTNEKGEEIDPESFSFRVELLDGEQGRVKSNDFSPVREGEQSVFLSDQRGNPSKFKVIYRLQNYPGMPPGDFSAQVRFSLGQN